MSYSSYAEAFYIQNSPPDFHKMLSQKKTFSSICLYENNSWQITWSSVLDIFLPFRYNK